MTFKRSGFTLIELIIAIAIMGILAAFIAPNFTGSLGAAEDKRRQLNVRSMYQIVTTYAAFNSSQSLEELSDATLVTELRDNGFSISDDDVCTYFVVAKGSDYMVATKAKDGKWLYTSSNPDNLAPEGAGGGDCSDDASPNSSATTVGKISADTL